MLWMVWGYVEVGKKKRAPRRTFASSIRFNRHKHRVNLVQGFFVTRFYNPALLCSVVFIEHTQFISVFRIRSSLSPRFERTRFLDTRALVQIISIEDQGLSSGIEHAAKGLLGLTRAGHIEDLRNIKVPSTHELADVTVLREQILLLSRQAFPLAQRIRELGNTGLQTGRTNDVLRPLSLQSLEPLLCGSQGRLSSSYLSKQTIALIAQLLFVL